MKELTHKTAQDLQSAIQASTGTEVEEFCSRLLFMNIHGLLHTGNLAEWYCKILWNMEEPKCRDGSVKRNASWDLKLNGRLYEVKCRKERVESTNWRAGYESIHFFLYVLLEKNLLPKGIWLLRSSTAKRYLGKACFLSPHPLCEGHC